MSRRQRHAVHTTPGLQPTSPTGQDAAAAPSMGDPNAAGGAPMVARVNQLKRMLQERPDQPQRHSGIEQHQIRLEPIGQCVDSAR